MSDKRKQFVRIIDQAIDLLRQAKSAGSLAPQNRLGFSVGRLIVDAERLRDDDLAWSVGEEFQGRMQSESGEFLGGPSER